MSACATMPRFWCSAVPVLLRPHTGSHFSVRSIKRWHVDTLRLMYKRKRDVNAVAHEDRHRSVWVNWNFKSELFAFKQRLGEGQLSEDALREVFTDEAFLQRDQHQLSTASNQRLATLGAHTIDNFAKMYLRRFLARLPEEGIVALVQHLTSDPVLASVANAIGATHLLQHTQVRPSEEALAKVVPALVGALQQEFGEQHARKFIIDFVVPYLAQKDIFEIWRFEQPHLLLASVMGRHNPTNDNTLPFEARLLRETGTNTILACYVVGLYTIDDHRLLGFSAGETPTIAKEMAAYDALRRMFRVTPAATMFAFGARAYDLDYSDRENATVREWFNAHKATAALL